MSSRYEELLQALLNGETADIVPQSRMEAALKNCIEGCGCDGLTEPKSRSEAYLQALAEKIKSGGGGNTGGGGIIDVAELPTENIDESAVYRVTQSGIEIYGVGMEETPVPYLQMMREQMSATINVEIVETPPDTLTPPDMENMILTIYVVKSTGIAYADMGEGAMTFGQMMSGQEGFDKGWSTDINAETEMGIYAYNLAEITLNTYQNGEWDVYVDDTYKEKAANLEDQVATIENENAEKTETIKRMITRGLLEFEIPSDIGYLGRYAFAGLSSLTSITIPDNIKRIDDYAFAYCSGLTGITIPDSVTRIGAHAFRDCDGFTNITIPDNVTKLGWGVFSYCSNLTSITLSKNTPEIYSEMFYYCNSLPSITVPDGATTIGQSAFSWCTSLTSITIPNSITHIYSTAFAYCSNLTDITFKGTKEQWKAITKVYDWDTSTGNYIVTCIDGTIAKDGTET